MDNGGKINNNKMVRCSVKIGKYCNEPYCRYLYHKQEAERWFQIFKNKLEAELLELKKNKIIENKLVNKKEKIK